MEPNNNRYAKAQDFADPQVITFGSIVRAPAEQLGEKFADSKGYASQLRFRDAQGADKQLGSGSPGLFFAFKNAGLTPGDRAFVQVIKFDDPETGKTYNVWAVQKLFGGAPQQVIQTAPQDEELPPIDW